MLMRYNKTVCLLSCIIGTLGLTSRLSARPGQTTLAKPPIDTSVSDILADSRRFNGKCVRLTASFQSDGLEHSVLLEPNCDVTGAPRQAPPVEPQCERGIIPWVPDGVEDHPDIEALDRALAKGRRGTIDKHIVATFTGRFVCKPSCTSRRGRVLEIEQVDKIDVVMKESKPRRVILD